MAEYQLIAKATNKPQLIIFSISFNVHKLNSRSDDSARRKEQDFETLEESDNLIAVALRINPLSCVVDKRNNCPYLNL
jgi:hypothetical protein